MKTLLIGLVGLCITANAWAATGPFSVNKAKDIDITTTRSSYDFGWQIEAQTDGGDLLGSVIDNNEAYTQSPYIVSGTDGLTFFFRGLGEEIAVEAGDSVTFTYLTIAGGGEVSEKIFFPAVTMNTLLYVGADNCTYSDSAFTTKVGMTPTPSATPTAALPTATPTPTTTPTVTPTPSVTPVTANIWYQAGDSIYPATVGSDLDLSGDMSVQSDITATSLTASMPVVTDASKVLKSGAGYWATFSSDAGSTTANTATDELDLEGSGITEVTISGDKATFTTTEADTLDSVTGRGATTSNDVSFGAVTSSGLMAATLGFADGGSAGQDTSGVILGDLWTFGGGILISRANTPTPTVTPTPTPTVTPTAAPITPTPSP